MSIIDKFLNISKEKENDVIIRTSKLTKTYKDEDVQNVFTNMAE